MAYVVGALVGAAWLYLLSVLRRSGLRFWHFLSGSVGLFLLLMVYVRPWSTEPLARAVAAMAGAVGTVTHTFSAYFPLGVVFVDSAHGAMTLQVDFECSGIVEIFAFVSLLAFYRVYPPVERALVGLIGSLFIVLANVARITVICEVIRAFGPGAYYAAHSLVGRIVFYGLTVLLYFYVFTKPHVLSMKVGRFGYDRR